MTHYRGCHKKNCGNGLPHSGFIQQGLQADSPPVFGWLKSWLKRANTLTLLERLAAKTQGR